MCLCRPNTPPPAVNNAYRTRWCLCKQARLGSPARLMTEQFRQSATQLPGYWTPAFMSDHKHIMSQCQRWAVSRFITCENPHGYVCVCVCVRQNKWLPAALNMCDKTVDWYVCFIAKCSPNDVKTVKTIPYKTTVKQVVFAFHCVKSP